MVGRDPLEVVILVRVQVPKPRPFWRIFAPLDKSQSCVISNSSYDIRNVFIFWALYSWKSDEVKIYMKVYKQGGGTRTQIARTVLFADIPRPR